MSTRKVTLTVAIILATLLGFFLLKTNFEEPWPEIAIKNSSAEYSRAMINHDCIGIINLHGTRVKRGPDTKSSHVISYAERDACKGNGRFIETTITDQRLLSFYRCEVDQRIVEYVISVKRNGGSRDISSECFFSAFNKFDDLGLGVNWDIPSYHGLED